MTPLPQHLHDSIRINWHLTSWCNYGCQYCPVMVFHQRSRSREPQAHAFDHRPVGDWLKAFRKFPYSSLHLKISGGEPFMDRKNLRDLLVGLVDMPHIRVGIDTNGSWNPQFFREVDTSRVWLNVSWHPTEITFDTFLSNLLAIRDAGFPVTMVNYVLAPENEEQFAVARQLLEQEGFFVNVSTLISTGVYLARTDRTERELDTIERHNMPLDNYFKVLKPPTKGRPCFYPAMSYYVMYDGSIRVACLDGTARNLFTDGIPELPRAAVPCEYDRCVGCVDMYRALADEPRLEQPLELYTLETYVRDARAFRRKQAWNQRMDRVPVIGPLLRHDLDTGAFRRALAMKREPAPIIPLPLVKAPLPDVDVFGGSDQRALTARSGDRISITGWVASRSESVPISELHFDVGAERIGTVRDFSYRPDVATAYGRPDLAKCGWHTMLFLPKLAHGEYDLVPRGVDRDGHSGELPAIRVHVVD